MRKVLYFLAITIFTVLASCSKDEEVTLDRYGSNRDWPYDSSQIEFYIDGVEQPQVTEITVLSKQLHPEGDNPPFPWYETTLKVKGLLRKNKIFNIVVLSDVERFEGTTTLNGIEYDVTGVYTGNPFHHHTEMGIIVNLNKK